MHCPEKQNKKEKLVINEMFLKILMGISIHKLKIIC